MWLKFLMQIHFHKNIVYGYSIGIIFFLLINNKKKTSIRKKIVQYIALTVIIVNALKILHLFTEHVFIIDEYKFCYI